MRNLMTAILALSGIGVVTLASSAPAMAYDYPWCAQGRGVGFPGDCSYQYRWQCLASASGRGLDCNINPRVAFRRARPGYGPYPDRYYPDPYYR
jgi:Protein of unknown function (DUF3551)